MALTTDAVQQGVSDVEERLLPAVEDLLYKHGYNGLNIRELAKTTGMGSATIYKYFGSKEQLALRVLQDQDRLIAAAVAPQIPQTGAAYVKWKSFYSALLSYYDEHARVAVIQNTAMPTSTWFLPEEKWPVNAVTGLIRKLIAEGRATDELDPAVTDNQIIATHYMHFVREVRLWRSRDMRWRLGERLETFFPIVWKTISAPGAPR
jgi:AcrR family transcriptional regulator